MKRLALAAGVLLLWAAPAQASTWTVDDADWTANVSADGTCDAPGADTCTLREALVEAFASGHDDIAFDAGMVGQTIPVTTNIVTVPVNTTIDGCSSSLNHAGPCVGLSNASGGPASGPVLQGASTTVRGLAISGFLYGIQDNTGGNTIKNNWVGIKLDGTVDGGAVGIIPFADGSTIGGPAGATGTTPADRNVVAGFSIDIDITYGDNNTIQGNYLGVKPDGTRGFGFGAGQGVIRIAATPGNPATGNKIGGTVTGAAATTPQCDGECNLIGPAGGSGIYLDRAGTLAPDSTTIQGNFIGANLNGGGGPAFGGPAILVGNATNSQIGGSDPAQANVIGNAASDGIRISDGSGNVITGNRIGKGPTGAALPNDGSGVRLEANSTNNTVGGTTIGEENLISKSGNDAITVVGAGSLGNVFGLNRGSGNGGLFVDLGDDGKGNPSAANSNAQKPKVTKAGKNKAQGTANAGATVLLFRVTSSPGSVKQFIGVTTADGTGNWTVVYPSPLAVGKRVAATQTALLNTSELSGSRAVS